MQFFQPLGFFALLAVPVILLMYLLKQKYKEQFVPSLFLWKRAQSYTMAQQPWQKLKKNLLLFLQIAAVFLLAIALANPFIVGGAKTSHTIFALDCSLSMQSKDGVEGTRLEEAIAKIKKEIEESPPNAIFSIVLLQDNPIIAISNSTDKRALRKQLQNITATNGGVDWHNGRELLQLAGEQNGQIVLFTDQYQTTLEDLNIQQNIIGKNSENTAITLLSHSQGGDGWQALVKVSYFGDNSIIKTVNLFCDGKAFDRKEITVESGKSKDIIFTGIPQQTTSITATLTPEDVLPADDRAYDGSFSQTKKKVLLVSEQNIFLEKVYSLLPDVELYKTDPQHIEQLSGYSLYLFDGVVPETLPEDGFYIFWNPPAENSFLSMSGEQNIDGKATAQGYGNMMLSETLQFDIEKANTFTMPMWASPLLEADQKPIAIAGEQNGKKIAVFAFDIHNTDLPLQKEFPIFIYNLQNWFFGQSQQQSFDSIQSGQVLEFSLLPETKQASVQLPDGKSIDIAPPFPPEPFTETQQTGIYTLVQKNELQQQYHTFAVNAKTSGESDLRTQYQQNETAKIQTENKTEQNTIKVGKSIQNIVILALLLLFVIEWGVNCREH